MLENSKGSFLKLMKIRNGLEETIIILDGKEKWDGID